MLNFLGFILVVSFFLLLSFFLSGIPSFILVIATEIGGLGAYMLSLMGTIFSLTQLVIFLSYLKGDNIQINFNFSLKAIVELIKALFSKDKKLNIIEKKATNKNDSLLNKIELAIVLGILIVAIFVTPHSNLSDLTYSNYFLRIFYYFGFALPIINLVNTFREEFDDSIFEVLFGFLAINLGLLLISLLTSGTILFCAGLDDYKYVDTIKSWYTYDKRDYDKKREETAFKGEYEFLKENITEALATLKSQYDLYDTDGYSYITAHLFDNINLKEYGYTITDSVHQEYLEFFCVLDKKTNKYNIYKLDYETGSLEKSSDSEFLKARSNKIKGEN